MQSADYTALQNSTDRLILERSLAPSGADDFVHNKRLVGFVFAISPPFNNEHERVQGLYFVLSFCLATRR
jgi:hypothetical protein